jgi:protein-disulfide isomerase-like protein with CxxC motif
MGGQMKQLPLLNGIFKAYADEQKDIGDIHVLAHIAESAGLMSYQEVSAGFIYVFPANSHGDFPNVTLTLFLQGNPIP